jgi:hypothetical protein
MIICYFFSHFYSLKLTKTPRISQNKKINKFNKVFNSISYIKKYFIDYKNKALTKNYNKINKNQNRKYKCSARTTTTASINTLSTPTQEYPTLIPKSLTLRLKAFGSLVDSKTVQIKPLQVHLLSN